MLEALTVAPRRGFVFKNWAGIYSCRSQLFFQPTSVDEVVAVVKAARQAGKSVVTVGAGHSPSDMCMTTEWLMSLDRLSRVISLKEHPAEHYADVTVEAGIRIYQLSDYLASKGYAIQNLGSISEQSVAGIICTGTHGSSPYHGLVSSQYVDLTIVNGQGEVVFLDSEHRPDVFRAALLSLGKIGVIVKATIRVVPKFNIKSTEELIHFETLLRKWDTIWTSAEFIRVWWYPYSRKCILWRGMKTQEPLTAPKKSWWGTFSGRFFYEMLLWIATQIYCPLTPYIERFVFHRQYGQVENYGRGETEISTSIDGLNMDCLFSQFVDEWGCPLDNGPEVLRSLDHSITQAAQNKEFYVHVPVEVRCSNTTFPSKPQDLTGRSSTSAGAVYGNTLRPYLDNTPSHCQYAPLSDVTNSQLTLYINATMYRPFHWNSRVLHWYTLFEDTMAAAGGKPHWAKNFLGSTSLLENPQRQESDYGDYEMRGMAKCIRSWYKDDLKSFQMIRREQDPDGVFLANRSWCIRNSIVDDHDLKLLKR
ncbi:probable D-arabinono-1,4-lactone oxidase [Zygosaccharomyces bailii ISA1307]|nr:probable D-arabinono-1,4-lactone oxidase [Zygosaccharomyces bailii ISA1307]